MVAVGANSQRQFQRKRGWKRIIRIRNGTLEKYLLLILLFGVYIFYANVTFLSSLNTVADGSDTNNNNAVDASNLGKIKGETIQETKKEKSQCSVEKMNGMEQKFL